jgi:hypothetical protein
MKNLLTSLAAASLTVIIYGCQSPDNSKLFEIAKMQELQAVEIEKISQAVKENSENIEKLKASPASSAKPSRENLVDAGILLLRNGPTNARYQAITILGYLGGEKAEGALLDMLSDNTFGRNYSSQIISALSTMRSEKLRGIVLKLMKSSNLRDRETAINAIQNRSANILTKEDLPLLIEVLREYPNNNNNYYRRINIIRTIYHLDPNTGEKVICEELETTPMQRQRELLYIPRNNNMSMSFKTWKKIIDILGDPNNNNLNTFYGVCEALSRTPDYRITDIVLPWALFAEQNSNFRRSYMNMLNNIKDPKAAKVFLEFALKDKSFSGYLNNFPGITKRSGEYQLVDEATMKKLLARRDKIVKRLNERDARKEAKNKAEKTEK